MKRRLLLFVIIFALLLAGCAPKEAAPEKPGGMTFTDALGRTVTVTGIDRVGIASGSIAECWMLAGGTVRAVTRDAVEERKLNLPEDVVDLGSLKTPSLEVIFDMDLDLMILTSAYSTHLAYADTLERAGIPYAYFEVETYGDYLAMLEIFTNLTGRPDLYEANGTELTTRIRETIENGKREDAPQVLLLRTSASKVKALGSDTMVGTMLRDLGCVNIADSDAGLLTDLSLEAIVQADPDYIFVTCMGDYEEGKAQMESAFSSNPIWDTLRAVEKGRCHFLEKELFHYKPNARWGESYEVLAELLADN